MTSHLLKNPLVKKIAANVDGRDFIIGDLHGCYDELLKLLAYVNFNTDCDRLFSTGDLLDRGPRSQDCLELLNEPWFHCILGNHEDILLYNLKIIETDFIKAAEKFSEEEIRYFKTFPKYVPKILKLPYVLEIEHILQGKFFIVHAEFLPEHLFKAVNYSKEIYEDTLKNFMRNDYTEDIFKYLNSPVDDEKNQSLKQKLIWSRKIVERFYTQNKDKIENSDFSFINNINTKYKIFCGHNVVPYPIKIGQQYYLDTGAALGYSNKTMNFKLFTKFGHEFFGLTMVEVDTGVVYHCITNEDKRGTILKLEEPLYQA